MCSSDLELPRDLLTAVPALTVTIYTADQHILRYCQIADRHDNAEACRAISEIIADNLFTHPDTSVELQWIPGTTSFRPIKRRQDIAIEAASPVPLGEAFLNPPKVTALRDIARRKVILDWEQV